MSFADFPLFLVRGGRLVVPAGRRMWDVTEADPERAVATMKAAVPPQELVYVYDVDGVEAGAANHEFYQRLERAHVPPWIDAGCRSAEDAMDAFFAGAEVLTVRLDAMPEAQLADFADIAEGEFHLLVSFETDHPTFPVTAGDLRTLVGELHAAGVIVEAGPQASEAAVERFAALIVQGGVDAALLSTVRRPWLGQAAKRARCERIIQPPEGSP